MDKIILPQMEFMACHGVYAVEKKQPQLFRVRVTMEMDLMAAGLSDDLNDTVNYGETYLRIKKLVEENTFDLIEKLAAEIAQLVLQEKPVKSVTVQVEKAAAQVTPEISIPACVEITRTQK
ncbi:MAG: dihydroneopterin aldolase [Peptococcaceae bacterium]|jgi:dihydroneopterin aldolase|nr:dihydroneopterin aldolase [Peptococcaceae bacterium]